MERSAIFLIEPVPGIERPRARPRFLRADRSARQRQAARPSLEPSASCDHSSTATVAPQGLLRADGKPGERAACGQTGANILVDRTGRDEHWRSCSANAGHWVLRNRYPVATRVQRTTKTFGNRRVNARFGTEGSEVQILSPRPLFVRKITEFSRLDSSVSPEWSVLQNARCASFPDVEHHFLAEDR